MKIRYTPKAREDLRNIKRYIDENLLNPDAAVRITAEITSTISLLKSTPYIGSSIYELTQAVVKDDFITQSRYFIHKEYIVIYRVEDSFIRIIRIISSKTAYAAMLLNRE